MNADDPQRDDTSQARPKPGEQSAARAWAHTRGIPVPDTGGVSRAILAEWRAAGSPVVAEARCVEPDCDNLAEGPSRRYPSLRLCAACWRRLRFGEHGDGLPSVANVRGRPWLYLCADCNRPDDRTGRGWSGRWAVAWCPPAMLTEPAAGVPAPDQYRALCRACLDAARRSWFPTATP